MRTIFYALVVILAVIFLAPIGVRFGYAWIGPYLGVPLLVFERDDSKLILLRAFVVLAPVLWALFPRLFVQDEPQPVSFWQPIAGVILVSCVFALSTVLIGGNYLTKARAYAGGRGYIACPLPKYKTWNKALMARDLKACREPGYFWPIFEAEI